MVLPALPAAYAAEAYPARPIRMIVPYAPGGGGDKLARTIVPGLTENLKQSVYVENRPGAGGVIGFQTTAKAPADGYTVMLGPSALTILPILTSTRYDPIKDFAPICLVSKSPYVLVVNPSLPATSVEQLIALARAKPGEMNFGSGGIGTGHHLAAELFKTMAGINLVHIAYKGGSEAVTALLGGQVQVMFANILEVLPLIRAGKVRALAVTSLQESLSLPGVPTVAAAGLPGYEVMSWDGLLAPAGTRPEVIARLHSAIVAALNQGVVRERLAMDGSEVAVDTPEQFAEFLRGEVSKWNELIRRSGARTH